MLDVLEDYHKGWEVIDIQENSIPHSTNDFLLSFDFINVKITTCSTCQRMHMAAESR